MPGTASLRLPECRSYWNYTTADVNSPATLARWLTEFVPRFPYESFWAAVATVEEWQVDRPDCPADLRPLKGYTIWSGGKGLVRLNCNYEVRDVMAHELGHNVQHHYGVLPDGDAAGALMYQVWRDLPGLDDEESFASAFGAYLLGGVSPFFASFPVVLDRWHQRPGIISSAVFSGDLFQWFDSGHGRLERYQGGQFLAYVGERWVAQ